jgi:hypothetical protein
VDLQSKEQLITFCPWIWLPKSEEAERKKKKEKKSRSVHSSCDGKDAKRKEKAIRIGEELHTKMLVQWKERDKSETN